MLTLDGRASREGGASSWEITMEYLHHPEFPFWDCVVQAWVGLRRLPYDMAGIDVETHVSSRVAPIVLCIRIPRLMKRTRRIPLGVWLVELEVRNEVV